MAANQTSFKKGDATGRPKGVKNRTTRQSKELLDSILLGEVDNVKLALDAVRKKDPAKYLDAISKLFAYVIPKKADFTSDDEKIQPVLNVIVNNSETSKTLEKLRNECKSD
jgi:hypothetical protein